VSGLGARLARLEAERREFQREANRIAARLGVPVAEVIAGAQDVVHRVRAMVDLGMTGAEVIAALAATMHTTPGELMRETGVTPDQVMRMAR
jgi:hypothetical protein